MTNLRNLIVHNQIAGIEVNFISDNEIVYHVVIVKIQKGKLVSDPIEQEIRNIEQLLKVIPPNIPVCLTLTGKGVIIKKYQNNDDEESIIKKILPFAKDNEFSFNTHHPQKDEESWAAIIRNEQLEKTSNSFLEAGLIVLDVFIGPFNLTELKIILDNSVSSYCTSSYQIDFSDNDITRIDKYNGDDICYYLSEETVKGSQLLALASSFTHLSINQCRTTSNIGSIVCSANDYKTNNVITLFMKTGVALLFVLLTINFLAYSHYSKKVDSINLDVFQNRSLLKKEKELKKELAEKKQLLARTGLDTKSHLAYYADMVASLRPKNMVFQEMIINPVEVNQYKKNLIVQKNTIRIVGNSNSSLQINNWVAVLGELKFVESVELFDLKYSNSKKLTEFILEITIRS